ncbi:MAG: cyclic nucleotide-binding domain-containing protein [Verrucomicrobiota bacterium]
MSEITLQPIGVLGFMSRRRISILQPFGSFHELAAEQILIEQGQEPNTLYIVVSGRLEVFKTLESNAVTLGQVESGDCLGEISLFEPTSATATVKAIEDCVLWSLGLEGLHAFMEQEATSGAQLLLGITQLLSRRLKLANTAIAASHVMPNHLCVRRRHTDSLDAENWVQEDKKGFEKLTGKKNQYKLPDRIKW